MCGPQQVMPGRTLCHDRPFDHSELVGCRIAGPSISNLGGGMQIHARFCDTVEVGADKVTMGQPSNIIRPPRKTPAERSSSLMDRALEHRFGAPHHIYMYAVSN